MMPTPHAGHFSRRSSRLTHAAIAAALTATVAACGGGDNPLDNPNSVQNPPGAGGRTLSFVYFQKCINPILLATITSSGGTSSCASAGCHDNVAGTGGALRVEPGATEVDLANPANTADAVRTSAMYKNFYSSQGVTVVGQPAQSRLLNKPLVRGTLHGGGIIFDRDDELFARRIAYWIGRPVPEGQNEFSSVANNMFTPADPQTGACNAD